MAGFRDKLAAQRTTDDARGLVWVGDADLTGYYRRRHPRVPESRPAWLQLGSNATPVEMIASFLVLAVVISAVDAAAQRILRLPWRIESSLVTALILLFAGAFGGVPGGTGLLTEPPLMVMVWAAAITGRMRS